MRPNADIRPGSIVKATTTGALLPVVHVKPPLACVNGAPVIVRLPSGQTRGMNWNDISTTQTGDSIS